MRLMLALTCCLAASGLPAAAQERASRGAPSWEEAWADASAAPAEFSEISCTGRGGPSATLPEEFLSGEVTVVERLSAVQRGPYSSRTKTLRPSG